EPHVGGEIDRVDLEPSAGGGHLVIGGPACTNFGLHAAVQADDDGARRGTRVGTGAGCADRVVIVVRGRAGGPRRGILTLRRGGGPRPGEGAPRTGAPPGRGGPQN